ncbi:hypothetical protein MKX01_025745 [Papaver californicum]|nr:hypothetical protein MKX01_025745 [Papaver californicum]
MAKLEEESLLEKRCNAYRSRNIRIECRNRAETRNNSLPPLKFDHKTMELVEKDKWKIEICDVVVVDRLVERNKWKT